MNIFGRIKKNKISRKKIDKYTIELGKPNLSFNNGKLKLYTYNNARACFLIDRTKSYLFPTISVFEDMEEGIHQAMQYINYKIFQLGLTDINKIKNNDI